MEVIEILAIKSVNKINKKTDRSLYLTRRDKKRIEKIYLVTLLFLAIGLSQMALARIIEFDLSGTVPMPCLMWLVTGLVCLTLMVYTELFDVVPINWTLGFVTVESMTVCVICYDWTSLQSWLVTAVVLTVLAVNVIVYSIASSCPLWCIPTYRAMLITTIVFTVLYIITVIVVFAVNKLEYMLIIDGLAFLYVTLMALYAGSLVHNRYLDLYRSDEYVISATIISSMFLYMIHLLLSVVAYSLHLKAKHKQEKY